MGLQLRRPLQDVCDPAEIVARKVQAGLLGQIANPPFGLRTCPVESFQAKIELELLEAEDELLGELALSFGRKVANRIADLLDSGDVALMSGRSRWPWIGYHR